MSETTVSTVSLNKLVASTTNVRQTNRAIGIEALAANIEARGLLQNLVVRAAGNGKYEVVAGGRRLAALQHLAKKKRLPKGYQAPVQIVTDDAALEVSLAENVMRQEMHPADQFAAFSALIAQGQSIEDVAAKFGVSPAVVTRRMKLAGVAPTIIEAFRADKLTLEQVMGFTVSDDHAEQERVFAEINGWHYTANRQQIVHLLTREKITIRDHRFRFVGEAAYIAAGGTITRDLFDAEDAGYADDGALVMRLAGERLAAMVPEYLAQGWKWIEAAPVFSYDALRDHETIYPRPVELSDADRARQSALAAELDTLAETGEELTYEQELRYDAIEAELAEIAERERAYDPAEKAIAGGWLTVERDGDARFIGGYVRPEDKGALAALRGKTAVEDANDDDAPDADDAPAGGPKLSDTLLTNLHAARTLALRNEIAQRPDIAIRALAHSLAVRQWASGGAVLTVHPTTTFIPAEQSAGIDETPTQNQRENWQNRLPEDGAALWDAIMALTDADVHDLIAALVAPLVDATYQKAQYGNSARPAPIVERLASTLDLNMRKHWTPTADNYFGRTSKDAIKEAVAEAAGEDAASKLDGLKKGAMAEEAAILTADTEWLPRPIRTQRD